MVDSKIMHGGVLTWGGDRVLVQILWIIAFAVFTALGAHVEIPHQPVPYTLQTLFVLLAGAMLGKRNGALSQLLYLTAGLVGLPVFSGAGYGIAKVIGPTGGYLLSFPVAALAVGYLVENHRAFFSVLVSMVVGVLIIFSLGTIHLYFVYYRDWSLAFVNGFLIFSWWDVLKILAAASIVHAMRRTQKT